MIRLASMRYPTKKLKYLVALRDSRSARSDDEHPFIGLENIEPWTGKLLSMASSGRGMSSPTANDNESMSNRFESGDVLFGKLRPYLAKAWIAEFPGRCTTEALVMEPHSIESRFLCSVCLSSPFIHAVDASTFGSKMPRADWDFIGNMPIPIPEQATQIAIADYLDQETQRLDKLVATKQRLLDLLAEKRRATVIQAVTRGINPDTRYRDFHTVWLTDVPKHWRKARLKDFGKFIAGSAFPHAYQGIEGEALPFYKVGDLTKVSSGRVMGAALNTIPYDTASKLGAVIVPKGSVIYAKIGAAMLLNRRRKAGVPCCIDNNMTAYVPHEGGLTSDWAYYWTTVLDFRPFANPGAVPSLSEGAQAQLPIAVPPLSEQRAITNELDQETRRIDKLMLKVQETILLLKERRNALISAAVTGKIDTGDSTCE